MPCEKLDVLIPVRLVIREINISESDTMQMSSQPDPEIWVLKLTIKIIMAKIKIKIVKDPMEVELDKALNKIIRGCRLNQNKILTVNDLSLEKETN